MQSFINSWGSLPPSKRQAIYFGIALGLCLSLAAFAWIPWYHDLLIWSWTTPWMYAIGIPFGIAWAVLSDLDD